MQKKIPKTPIDFWNDVAVEANGLSVKLVKDVYYGILRVLLRELKVKEKLKLDDLGTFVIHIQKGKKMNHFTGRVINFDDTAIIKFVPDIKLKRYVKERFVV
jgi:nucleoid DNA-binding protein